MTLSTLVDLVKIQIVSTGSGIITLGSPVQGYRGIEALIDGRTYSYSIQQNGNYEVGTGTYLASGHRFSRSPQVSSAGGVPIDLQPGAVLVFTALAEDFAIPGPPGSDTAAYLDQMAADVSIANNAANDATVSQSLAAIASTSAQVNASNAAASALAAAALYAGRFYTTAALGDAGTTAGQSYLVTDGGNPAILSLWLHNGSGGADQHWTVPSGALVLATMTYLKMTVGRPTTATLTTGNATTGNYTAVFVDSPATVLPKTLNALRVYIVATGEIRLAVFASVTGGIAQQGPTFPFTASATGIHTFTATDFGNIVLQPGQMLGISANGIIGSDTGKTADGAGFYTLVVDSFAGTPSGPFTNQQLQVGLDFNYDQNSTQAQSIAGNAPAPTTGTGGADYGLIFAASGITVPSDVEALDMTGANGGGAGLITVWNATTRALLRSYPIVIPSGTATLTPADFGLITVNPGELLGIYPGTKIASDTGKVGSQFYATAANASPYSNGTLGGAQRLMVRYWLRPRSRVLDSLDSRITALSNVVVTPTARKLRARLERVADTSGTIVLIGDSEAEHYYASTFLNHWFEKFRVATIGDVDPDSRTGITNFGPGTGGRGIAWYSLTTAGSVSNGTTGPIGQTLVLAAGASVSFTGKFASIAYCYDRAVSAGTLALTRANSGSPVTIDTFSTAGAAATDLYHAAATGNTGSDTYTLTASVGSVTITALFADGARAAGVKVPRFHRIALQGQASTLFADSTRLASIIAQVTARGGTPFLILQPGVNDAVNGTTHTTPALLQSNYEKTAATLLATGAYVACLGILRPDPTTFPTVAGGTTMDDFLAAQLAACEKYNVPLLALDGFDFVGLDDTADLLHPNDQGFALIAQLFQNFVTSGEFDRIHQQPGRMGRIEVAGSGGPEGVQYALGASRYLRTDGGTGTSLYVKETAAWGNTGWVGK